ncbi:phosphomevalonate kinase protein, putative [Trypanosoma brucei brucei TREU927]|uniref:phosphomevalonate kinase n=1 Tax=Trypanosoma brucei brucei (strain 927/4 GUTat10.1) TaxID=185431 RepID=Q38F36_TRYB2|nr:phosphomevalonate kinase protein, putative [Trypanosoma brucei brucei TREU927]EAN76584.1 phosphomevalonate kinase protein, putative [Trypanosoma brucei brucei TREU927]
MVVASCPGKVLILGGYLIVEEPNVGISVGTTARFVTRVASWKKCSDGKCRVHIVSSQFNKEFTFECAAEEDSDSTIKIVQLEGAPSPFLFYGILYSVAGALLFGGDIFRDVTLELLADNDFYSQRNYLESQGKPVTAANLRLIPRYTPLLGEVSKTGLGSSAAMTTSVVACLLQLYVFDSKKNNATESVERAPELPLRLEDVTEFIHRISQVAHCVAQGKVGSGFDVYTATFGTCVYRRFSARVLEKLVKGNEPPKRVTIPLLRECVETDEVWVQRIPFRLPTGLQLLLGDVHKGGTETPGMVSKVMSWRRSVTTDPNSLWERLRMSNEKYVEALQGLIKQSQEAPVAYTEAVKNLKSVVLAKHNPSTEAERLWVEAASVASTSRRYLREMGEAAQVQIEPPELTSLLDATCSIPGVFAVGCPGAGGYDAVFALVLGEEVCSAVERFWECYNDLQVCPLLVRGDANGLVLD